MEVFAISGVSVLVALLLSGIYSFTHFWMTIVSALILIRIIRTSSSKIISAQLTVMSSKQRCKKRRFKRRNCF